VLVPRMRKLLGALAATALTLTAAAGLTTTASAATPTLPNATHATTPQAFVPPVLDGTHTISSGGLDLDVPGSSPNPGTQLDTWTVAGSANQDWNFQRMSDFAYELVNSSSNLCADVNGGSTNAGAVVDQWSCLGSANEQWFLTPLVNGSYLVTSVGSGLVLTTASTANGAALTQQVNTDSPQQQWTIGSINPALYGYHTLVTGGQTLWIPSASGGDYESIWTFVQQSDGSYELHFAGGCVTVTTTGEVEVVGPVCAHTTNQRWILTTLSNGSVTVTSALNGQLLTSNDTYAGATTQPNSNSPQQQFTIGPSPQPNNPDVDDSTALLSTEAAPGLNLAVAAGSNAGAWLDLVTANPNSESQNWGFKLQSDGSWEFANVASGLCAEVQNGSTAVNALVDQGSCVGSANQRWYFTPLANGAYIVSSASNGLLLSAQYPGPGSLVLQQVNSNDLQQQWTIHSN
jgi:hypothetical protein